MASKDKGAEQFDEEEITTRKRTFSVKGRELFISTNSSHLMNIENFEKNIVQVGESLEKQPTDVKELQKCRKKLNLNFHKYNQAASEYVAFLARTETVESDTELEKFNKKKKDVEELFNTITTKIDNLILASVEEYSAGASSKHSKSSKSEKLSVKLAEKRAQSEAARAALAFVEKESDLIRRQAELEAEKTIIEQKKLYASLQAEVRVLEEEGGSSVKSVDIPAQDPKDRTAKYVADLDHVPRDQAYARITPSPEVSHFKNLPYTDHDQQGITSTPLNPRAEIYVPPQDLSKLFLRKELMLHRLAKFDDSPESYGLWKSSFSEITSELQLSHVEQLDLLIKWLGPQSLQKAKNIRRANLRNPEHCLELTWTRLDEAYGNPESVLASLEKRLNMFPVINQNDYPKLYDLYDLLSELEGTKGDPKYEVHLAYFDSPAGINPIASKLPNWLREKWEVRAFKYKERHCVTFPPFSEFVEFIHEISRQKNDPSFAQFRSQPSPWLKKQLPRTQIQVRKTDVERCPLHGTEHKLENCNSFKAKSYEEKIQFMKSKGLCFRCANPQHLAKNCKEPYAQCDECGGKHLTCLHMTRDERSQHVKDNPRPKTSKEVSTKCTEICGAGSFGGKSCAKTLLVQIYPEQDKGQAITVYVIMDDQGNACLATTKFFQLMNLDGEKHSYSLTTCAGSFKASGQRASGFVIESLSGDCALRLPPLIECNSIPNNRDEIATPAVAKNHHHLADIVEQLPPIDNEAEILVLIGRNMTEAFHVEDQRIGPRQSPYAQKLPLGWVVIGETCLNKQHATNTVNVNKTFIASNGRPTLWKPCTSDFKVKEDLEDSHVFKVAQDDDQVGLSTEDREFLEIMDGEMFRNENGNWSAPLPLKNPRPKLPNNRKQAEQRAKSLHNSLCRDTTKKSQMLQFMQKIIEAGHCEIAPPIENKQEVWYLPLFGVRHPRKPEQIRGVFDSSAAHQGLSLNSVLLQGPDLLNRLLHVLLCFRKEPVAIMGDVEKMFYCFEVNPQFRDLLRFLWYKENDPENDLIEYRMRVHVFGNKSSPAVATYGLRRIAEAATAEFGSDVEEFIHKNFYVDDGLTSLSTVEEAKDLLLRTQKALQKHGNMRFHKMVSNSQIVMDSFPPSERSKDLQDIDIRDIGNPLSVQRSLGVSWNISTDMFMLQVADDNKPFTKRGVLSTIGSIYDPLGFFSPVVIKGKLIMRDLLSEKTEWDDPLQAVFYQEWKRWRDSLKNLETVRVPRAFVSSSFKEARYRRLLVFCDASEQAIAAVAYLKLTTTEGTEQTGFVMGKVKIAPSHGHTIPRLELCSATLATELADTVCRSLNLNPADVSFFSDSKIVLGYLRNRTKRFKVYISNRVSKILKFSNSDQWKYVLSARNPADDGTRVLDASSLKESAWLKGPESTFPSEHVESDEEGTTVPSEHVESHEKWTGSDSEEIVVSEVTHFTAPSSGIGVQRFNRFSSWKSLVNGIVQLSRFARKYQTKKQNETDLSVLYRDSEDFIVREVQRSSFSKEIRCLEGNKPVPKDSPLSSLNPFIDASGLVRVGGRLSKGELNQNTKHPIILPKKFHVSELIVRHFHSRVCHQGRHFTEGAVRSGGFYILGAKRLVSSLIHNCVTCRKLRGRMEPPKMADLPFDRLEEGPPFTYMGLDVFGPWSVTTRRTRGGSANSKRWAVLFTCMVTRAIHIEVVEELSSSAFINALRRFVAIRGEVKLFRSDRGTNFIGAINELNINVIEEKDVKSFLKQNRINWVLNPPHASHMGGSWERMIGICRRILESMLTDIVLTHDILVTLLAEVCAIVNNRPLVPVSSDPDNPFVLSPSHLLTQKSTSVANLKDAVEYPEPGKLYKAQWKRVQQLADRFWSRWRSEYLPTLQTRRKWKVDVPNFETGDIVLLKSKDVPRNVWPMAVVEDTEQGKDGRVRTVTVRSTTNGKPSKYIRPVTALIPLLKFQ